ncbi:MAG: peptidylprolyl isomerase [Candidatus Alkaliphilus sp. MAG34]|nr:peptidylprolyl isomerase [Clostridiales bacterium]
MKDKKVLATVGGREILEQDLNLVLGGLDPQKAAHFKTEEGKRQLLDDLIAQELIYLDAVKNGLDKNEAFIKEAQKMYNDFLKQFAVLNLLKGITVTEDELSEFYNENTHIFTESETIKASHILVGDEEQADEVIKEINDGLSFEEAAKKYSNCPTNVVGGDLGYFGKGKMVPEFETVAFDMGIGETSDPVKTQFGYHIIKLVDKKEGIVKSFDEVKSQLKQQLTLAKQQRAYIDRANELKKEYQVIINE